LPFEFDRVAVRKLVGEWRQKKEEELGARVEKAERSLRPHILSLHLLFLEASPCCIYFCYGSLEEGP